MANATVTSRQYQVLRLIKQQGFSVPEIADELEISFDTARQHVRNLRDLGLVKTARGRRSTTTVDLRRFRPSGFKG